jgi:hypothetical protein
MIKRNVPSMMTQDFGRPPVYLGTPSYLPNFGGDGGGHFGARPPQIARPGGFAGGYGPSMKAMAGPDPVIPKLPDIQGMGGGIGDALKGIAGGVGGAIGKGVDWLTDEDKGYLRQLLLSNVIGTAGSIYEANKVGKQEDEDRKRKERSRASATPMFGQLLAELSQR